MDETSRMIAIHLNTVIAAKGLKKRWIAEQVGVSESLVGKIALQQRPADVDLARRIANAVGVPVHLIFTFHDRNIPTPQVDDRIPA